MSEAVCDRCSSPLHNARCTDETCPFFDYAQDDPRGWADHPSPPREHDWLDNGGVTASICANCGVDSDNASSPYCR